MRRTKNQDMNRAENNTIDISKMIKIYFNDVIKVKGFIMAIDETGVYFFTTENDQNTILVKLTNYMDQLALSKEDVVVCRVTSGAERVTNDVFFKRIQDRKLQDVLIADMSPDCLEESIRLLTSSRKPVLSRADVIDIVECFRPSTARSEGLYNFLASNGFKLDLDAVSKFEDAPLVTLQDVVNAFGENNAEEIYDLIASYRKKQQRANVDDESVRGESTFIDSEIKTWDKNVLITSVTAVLLLVASIAMYICHLPLLGVLFALCCLLNARHLALIYRNLMATILTWFSIILLVFGIISTIGLFNNEIIQWLKDKLLIER